MKTPPQQHPLLHLVNDKGDQPVMPCHRRATNPQANPSTRKPGKTGPASSRLLTQGLARELHQSNSGEQEETIGSGSKTQDPPLWSEGLGGCRLPRSQSVASALGTRQARPWRAIISVAIISLPAGRGHLSTSQN
jgi:hypothetical protein